MSHWFRGIFILRVAILSSRPPREGGRVRTFFLCDSLFVPPSPPSFLIFRTVRGMPPLLFFGKAFLSYVLCGTPPRFVERPHFLLFCAPKEGLWTSPMSRSEKVCSASAVSRLFSRFFSVRVFSRWRFSGVRGRRLFNKVCSVYGFSTFGNKLQLSLLMRLYFL